MNDPCVLLRALRDLHVYGLRSAFSKFSHDPLLVRNCMELVDRLVALLNFILHFLQILREAVHLGHELHHGLLHSLRLLGLRSHFWKVHS